MTPAWTKRLPDAIAQLGPTRLIVSAIALLFFSLLCALTKAQISFSFEANLIIWLRENITGLWGNILSLCYYAGDTESAGIITAIVVIYLFIRRWWQEGLWFSIATAGALYWVGIVFKPLFDKDRPPFERDPSIHGAAFPSGHATGNTILYFFIAYLLASQYPHLGRRFHLIAVGWLILMGLGSMRVGAHWPTDIMGGYCLGFLWLMVCLAMLHTTPYLPLLKRLPRRKSRAGQARDRSYKN